MFSHQFLQFLFSTCILHFFLFIQLFLQSILEHIFSNFFALFYFQHQQTFLSTFSKIFFWQNCLFLFRIFKFFKLHIYNLFVKQIFDIFWHFLTVSSSPQSYKPLFFFILSANSQFSIFVIFMNFLFNS